MEPPDKLKGMSYFRESTVSFEGREFRLTLEDGRAIESRGNYWHGPGDPSTWLSVDVFLLARERVGDAGDLVALELAADALGITVQKLRDQIEWHENYMRWHDGDSEYRIL